MFDIPLCTTNRVYFSVHRGSCIVLCNSSFILPYPSDYNLLCVELFT